MCHKKQIESKICKKFLHDPTFRQKKSLETVNGSIRSPPPTNAAIDKGQMKVLVGNCRLVDRHLVFIVHRVEETINQI